MNNSTVPIATLADPERTERVGRALAAELTDLDVTLVSCWDSCEDTVLAHVVARELGVRIDQASQVEGLVVLAEPLTGNPRVALVGERFAPHFGLAALSGVVSNDGGTVVAVAAATGTVTDSGTAAAGARCVTGESR